MRSRSIHGCSAGEQVYRDLGIGVAWILLFYNCVCMSCSCSCYSYIFCGWGLLARISYSADDNFAHGSVPSLMLHAAPKEGRST
jgi:hypothetical protein